MKAIIQGKGSLIDACRPRKRKNPRGLKVSGKFRK